LALCVADSDPSAVNREHSRARLEPLHWSARKASLHGTAVTLSLPLGNWVESPARLDFRWTLP